MNQYHAWLGNRRFAKMEEKSEQRHWKYQQAANAKWEEIKKRLDEFQLKAQEDQQVTRSRLREFRLNNQEIQQGTRAKVDEFQLELQSCRLANKELRFSVEKLKAHLFDYKLPSHRAEISCKQVLQKGDLSSPQGLPPSIESAEMEKESVAAMEPTVSVPVACETWSSPNAASMRRIQGAKTLVRQTGRKYFTDDKPFRFGIYTQRISLLI